MTTNKPSVINDFIIFFRRASHSICFGVLSHRGVDIPTAKHSSTMHEKYARKFHKASAYSSWRLHVCRNWCMGFAGQYFKLTITNILYLNVSKCTIIVYYFVNSFQDGSYTYSNFTKSFEDYDIQRVMRAYENSITINLHCCEEGNWQQEHVDKEQFSEFCQVDNSL